jgi:hypothetical protein
MTKPRIIHTTKASTRAEQPCDARARAWAYVFDCYRKKEGSRPGAPDDGTEVKEDSANEHIIQR